MKKTFISHRTSLNINSQTDNSQDNHSGNLLNRSLELEQKDLQYILSNPNPNSESNSPFKHIQTEALKLIRMIRMKSENLNQILSDYQTYNVTEYEIERSIRTLRGIHENYTYLNTNEKINSIAVMLPSNLPLYSLIVFAIIPSFLSSHVNVRPNSLLQEHNIISRIYDELELNILFPNISIINTDHSGFKQHISEANLVVFTGNPSNAEKFLASMKENSFLVVNGAGHNPVVVTETADLDLAIEGALLVKGFNGGQDCAGPDAILVHHNIATEFIERFQKKFSELKTGLFTNEETIIGPIGRLTELQKFATIFHNNSKDIISGGYIDFRSGIVSPTVIVRGIERYPNYKEVFGPIAFIHPYKKDSDLSYYFEDADGQYKANKMYVSVYGQSDYISKRNDLNDPRNPTNVGIVLHNETIHDIEIGYKEYGGYSLGASGLMKKLANKVHKVAMPILIPQVISEYIIGNKEIPLKEPSQGIDELKSSSVKTQRDIDPIIKDFQDLAMEVFGSNLLFGFVFGSAAKGKLKVKGPNVDDLDTFICLQEDDEISRGKYITGLTKLHEQYNLKVDETFPAEIVTFSVLNKILNYLEVVDVDVDKIIRGREFDWIFWIHALTDKKIGFVGDNKIMHGLIKEGLPHIKRWSLQIIKQLKEKDRLPENLCMTFSGLGKDETIEKLSRYSPHLIVHLGLNYDGN